MSRDRVKLNGGSLYRTPQALLASFGVYKNRVPKEQKIQREIKGGGRTKGGGGEASALKTKKYLHVYRQLEANTS